MNTANTFTAAKSSACPTTTITDVSTLPKWSDPWTVRLNAGCLRYDLEECLAWLRCRRPDGTLHDARTWPAVRDSPSKSRVNSTSKHHGRETVRWPGQDSDNTKS